MHDRSGPILQQWKDLEPEFPQMSMVARVILAVPAADVGCCGGRHVSSMVR